MNGKADYPRTLQQAIQYFSDEQVAIDEMASLRWPDGVRCVACESNNLRWMAKPRRWKCRECGRQFSVKLGTVMEDSPIPLTKWMPALWLLSNCKNGVSSWEVHRALGVTQKTAWFMLHRLRMALSGIKFGYSKIGGPESICEADETFVGGKVGNMSKSRRKEMAGSGGGRRNKTVVIGVLDRDANKVRTEIIPFAGRDYMQKMVRKNVKFGSTIFTDEHIGYHGLANRYTHEAVNHMVEYVRGRVHTQGIENFWSLLKRQLHGTYIAVEPFHLHRYCDEQVFRYENRNTKQRPMNDADRFRLALSQVAHKRLTYAELTGKNDATTPF